MGDDIYEAFEINEFDLENAMNPGKRRRFTKHQQTYGVFADELDDDEEEEEKGEFGKKNRKKKDYTTPLNFVSGGVKKGDKIEEEEVVEEIQIDEDDAVPSARFQKKKTKQLFKKTAPKFDDRTSFAGIRNTSMAGFSGTATGHGNWEKHTKGIGMKLLSKMGYVAGKGLGKSGQGIVEPITASLRPGRGAIGAYGSEGVKDQREKKTGKDFGGKSTTYELGDDGEGKEKKGNRQDRWRKDGGGSRTAKSKLKYKTWQEVVAEGGNLKKQLAGEHKSVKVIDMTGKEKKVFSGYEVFQYKTREFESDDEDFESGTTGQKSETSRTFDVPELRQNLDILVDMTEDAIVQNDRQLKYLKDQKVALTYDDNQLTTTIETEERQMNRLRSVMDLLDKFVGNEEGSSPSLDDCKELFKRLQRDYYEEYKMYGLSSLAISNVLPLVKEHFSKWNPLTDPEHGYEMMDEWKSIFDDDRSNYALGVGDRGSKLDNMHPYHRLFWDGWMPLVRRCVLEWDPKQQCDEMVNLVSQWSPILPGWILENVLEQMIFPKLQREVENWNPMTDTTPIHFWLHPWLPFMGDRLQPIYAPIRHKLGRALVQWHPSDPSAKNVLKPWKDVFTLGAMQNFLSQNILPKLELCLAEMRVNPTDQDLRPWHWVMDWLDMVNPASIADALARNFFPKWHHTLITWLNMRTANYNEISQWYIGWKSLFHADLLAFQLIRDQFTHALELMNQAISNGGIQPTAPQMSQPQTSRVASEVHQRHMDILASRATGSAAPANFKDLVERKAEESGLLFMPLPNKFREGKPIYRFGSCQVYLDRNVVFLLQPSSNQWIPVSLEQLVSSASS